MKNNRLVIPCPFTSAIGIAMAGTGGFMMLAGYHFSNLLYVGLGLGLIIGGIIIAMLKGSVTVADEGLIFEMPFRFPQTIPYDEVDWVNVDVEAEHSLRRSSMGRALIYKLTIVTRQGNIVATKQSGYVFNTMPLHDVYGKNKVLLNSPFSDIERSIRERKGFGSDPLALSEYLREGKAKKL